MARAPLAGESPVVLSSESSPAVVVLTPTGAPDGAPTAGVGGVAGLKALELRSSMEGGMANAAYAASNALSAAYYSYSPPPDGGAVILPPPPLVYVKETITTVTTTYPAGTPVPVPASATPTPTRGIDSYFLR